MSKRKFTVYDPREGNSFEWRAPDGRVLFSGASSGTYVVEASGIDWNPGLVERIFTDRGTLGIVAVSPWAPGTETLRARLRAAVPGLERIGGVEYGTFPYSTSLLGRLLAVRAEGGGWASGEWCLGAMRRGVDPGVMGHTEEFGGALETLAFSSPEALGAVLVQRELQRSLLAVHLNVDEVDASLDRLGEELNR
jgi:hypothetical protein